MREWKEHSLKNITTKIGSGATPTGGKESYLEQGVTLIRSLNIYDFEFEYKDLAFINEAQAKKLNNVIVEKNDILLNITGASVGRCTIVPEKLLPARVNQHVSIIRVDTQKADVKFMLYLINSSFYKESLLLIADTGSTREALTKDDIEKFKVRIPVLSTQQRIASILSAYDELIEINNERIKLLEETARALHNEWFVRMRFPGYKKIKFVKGVPKGWEVKQIKDFGKVITGKTPSTFVKEYYGGGIPFIKTPDMHGNMFILKTDEYISEKGLNSQKSQTLPMGSLIVNCIGALSGAVSITTEISQTNQQIHSIKLFDSKNLEFLFFTISDLREMIHLYGNTGSTMTNLSKGKFENLKLLYPTKSLIEDYNNITHSMFEKIKILVQQNTHLRQIRDRLLPRLVSGKLAVKLLKEYEINEALSMAAEPGAFYTTKAKKK